jgi:hypothetical protein
MIAAVLMKMCKDAVGRKPMCDYSSALAIKPLPGENGDDGHQTNAKKTTCI